MSLTPVECANCGAKYRLPESFKADKAKCKKCGGVVEIGAVEGGGKPSEAAPAKKPVPAKTPAARPKPAAAAISRWRLPLASCSSR